LNLPPHTTELALDAKYRSLNGAVGKAVYDLMVSRSFELEDEEKGSATYSRHEGDIRLFVTFKNDAVRKTKVEYSGQYKGRFHGDKVRSGWRGLEQFAGSLGDSVPERADDARALHKRIKWHGLDISIENEAGSVRHGTDRGGNAWVVTLTHDYGYLRKTQGVDGDHLDCFVGPDDESEYVYVIHTMKAPEFTEIDEDKCMLNFSTPAEAKSAFFSNYDRPEHFGSMDIFTVDEFIERALATKNDPQLITSDVPVIT